MLNVKCSVRLTHAETDCLPLGRGCPRGYNSMVMVENLETATTVTERDGAAAITDKYTA